MKQTILFCFHPDRIKNFYPLIKFLSNEFEILILTTSKNFEKIEQTDTRSFAKIYFADRANLSFKTLSKMQTFLSKYTKFSLAQIALKYVHIGYFINEHKITSKIYKKHHFKALIPHDDRTIRHFVGSIVFAKKHNIAVILPYLYLSGYYTLPMLHNPKYWEKSNLCKYQNYTFKKFSNYGTQKYEEHFYFPAFIIQAQYSYHKFLSKNPFFTGCGTNDIVILDNEITKFHYSKVKEFDMKKVEILGDINLDNLHKSYQNRYSIKEKFKQKYHLDDRKIAIFAAQQLYEHGCSSFDECLADNEFIINSIIQNNIQLIISLHPVMNIANYAHWQQKFPCVIADENLMDFLPIGDIFIHGNSSTAIWAIFCGVKTLNLWFWGDDSIEFFKLYKSMWNLYDRNLTKETIKKLIDTNIDFSDDWNKMARDKVFDGKTKQRYLKLLKSL